MSPRRARLAALADALLDAPTGARSRRRPHRVVRYVANPYRRRCFFGTHRTIRASLGLLIEVLGTSRSSVRFHSQPGVPALDGQARSTDPPEAADLLEEIDELMIAVQDELAISMP